MELPAGDARFREEDYVRHLLYHTSGLRNQWTLLVLAGWRMDDVITQEDIMKLLRNQKELNFSPGEDYDYSNSGDTLLSDVVTKVAYDVFNSRHLQPNFFQEISKFDTIRQWRMFSGMEFVETPTFTRLVLELMKDDDYAKLQAALALRPDLGQVIPSSGGIRKARWAGSGRGKRGGLRILYYWQFAEEKIWMLLAYPKSERDDLSRDQIRQLKILVQEFLL